MQLPRLRETRQPLCIQHREKRTRLQPTNAITSMSHVLLLSMCVLQHKVHERNAAITNDVISLLSICVELIITLLVLVQYIVYNLN